MHQVLGAFGNTAVPTIYAPNRAQAARRLMALIRRYWPGQGAGLAEMCRSVSFCPRSPE